ncbi:MAG: short-chain dehydrogenase [Acidimicrobiaceae bacterium]|nr:short-chain dehydrogenase [Acidimicrobiaceae bacterium]
MAINSPNEPITFKDQVVVVTGGARGLGRDYSLELGRRGAAVIVNGISTDADGRTFAEKVVEEIRAAGGTATADHHSISDSNAAALVIDAAIKEFGQVDAVINNAGFNHYSLIEDTDLDLYRSLIEMHLIGSFLVSKRAYEHMVQRGYGRIVLTASMSGMYGRRFGVGYTSAKTGLIGLMNSFSIEGAERGVFTNVVNPSAKTTILDRSITRGDVKPAELFPEEEAPRGMPPFVTPLVLYLASNQCKTSKCIFNAAYGRYAREAIAQAPGWRSEDDVNPPTLEELSAHWDEVCRMDGAWYPTSSREDVLAAKSRG